MTKSIKIFLGLLLIYSFLAAISIYFPQINTNLDPQISQSLPASKPIMALAIFGLIFVSYGILGFLGLKLAKKIGVPDVLSEDVLNKQRFLFPAIAGIVCGIVLIIGDNIFSRFNGIGYFAHPAFPVSILAAISAGVGEEILFRLFFISFWAWLISRIILRGKYSGRVFWVVAVLSAIVFGVAHYPAIMYLYGFHSFLAMPFGLQIELISLNGLIGLAAAYYYKKSGYLGAVSVHFWTDIVWHAIYGALIML